MFATEPSPQLVLSYVVVWTLTMFLIGIGNRFVETITDRATETHLSGGFVSGLYLGFSVDPDAMIIQELAILTAVIGSSAQSFILTSLAILSAMEIILGFFYIWDKRGKTGAFGSVLVMCSGYVLAQIGVVGIIPFLIGILFYISSERSGF